jgi:hypothetical protein
MRQTASILLALMALAVALRLPAAQAQFLDPGRGIQACKFKHSMRLIAALGDLPPTIRNAVGPIAEKGAFFNAIDVYQPGVPNRRFMSAGASGDRYFVWYQQGGIFLMSQIAVYQLPSGGGAAELVALGNASGGDLCQTIDDLLDAKPPR